MATTSFLRPAILALGLLVLAACTTRDPAVQQVREQIAATLPAPYFEDLVTESVEARGKRLVFLIRSPEGDADTLRKNPRFDELHQSEQRELPRLCALPAIAPLRGTDAVLVRRFVDASDKLIFEVSMPASECPAPRTAS
ncbi:hypothetical protein CSC70_03755 [Pseudoxanthomonas kalamensis DSM 18571]|uniref:hypothetical protein n=1 Tax=Pseudoxanthomonas kalamensis TaxID=289483 RepID=UPI001390BC60|nr:hypothetical protein [Pseudoxanthomonas kalamensis]KAF1712624.1 hypothetical protein CSC70_03755 [Pseudoxanthomonas kalamensis DSM 18571]